ncbi:urease accessory protein UreF [Leptolyngbyaceae cyanobacterium JSC-12]|nr:urease accessory protein UreF [Leptolyngbyaceae cyanobacterium JSC-12]
MKELELLRLLQLASPALPTGAYSYSEGLEWLVETGTIASSTTLEHWLTQELRYGAVRLEAAVMLRVYQALQQDDWAALQFWDQWLLAARETEELRSQSLQMGRSLLRLASDLQLHSWQNTKQPSIPDWLQSGGCNFATAYAITAVFWQINQHSALLGYLHSWATNLINAGIKLIPLGQTVGQQLLLSLHPRLITVAAEIAALPDDRLDSCSWGLAIASMAHEMQYSRLFRS